MKLIIGLGNPGKKYAANRHNVGFRVAEELVIALLRYYVTGVAWKFKKGVEAQVWEGDGIVVAKPQTYMNNSGRAVKKLINHLTMKQWNNDLYVVHDDLDIRLGEYKIQKGKGPKKHKGVESVEQALGTKGFWRVRVGVDNRTLESRIPGEEYVLQDFTPEEQEVINSVIKDVVAQLNAKIKN